MNDTPRERGDRSEAFEDRRWLSDNPEAFDEIRKLLGIPRLEGFQPVAITAVLVTADGQGRAGRYPIYAQLMTSRLSEEQEIETSVRLLRRWLRRSRRSQQPSSND